MTVAERLDKMIAQGDQELQLLRLIYAFLGGTAVAPKHFTAEVQGVSMQLNQRKGLVNRPSTLRSPRIPGGNVNVHFSWDAASDGGVTQGYVLTVFNPDGSQAGQQTLGLVQSFDLSMADDDNTYTATIFATASDGTAGPVSSTSFVPHTEAPPPPPTPGAVTGFRADVS